MEEVILLAEDDEDLAGIYKEILELHGFDAVIASNGEEGVKKFAEVRPSLAIMDGDMPVLDGYQAFKQIKKIDADANVIIIAGFQEVSPKSKEAIREGLIKVISKPLGIGELLSLAKKYSVIKVEK